MALGRVTSFKRWDRKRVFVEGAIMLKVKGKSYRAEKAKAAENHSS